LALLAPGAGGAAYLSRKSRGSAAIPDVVEVYEASITVGAVTSLVEQRDFPGTYNPFT